MLADQYELYNILMFNKKKGTGGFMLYLFLFLLLYFRIFIFKVIVIESIVTVHSCGDTKLCNTYPSREWGNNMQIFW